MERSSRLVIVADITFPPGLKKISFPTRITAVFGFSEDIVVLYFILVDEARWFRVSEIGNEVF